MLCSSINPVNLTSPKDLARYLQKHSSHKSLRKEAFLEGANHELELVKKSYQEKEARYLNYLQNRLRELNKKSSEKLEEQEILEITKSAEAFNRYFQEESRNVWNGILDELKKEGANQSFIEGMQKEAAGFDAQKIYRMLSVPFRRFARKFRPASSPQAAAPASAPAPNATPSAPAPAAGGGGGSAFTFSPGGALKGLAGGALTGGMLGGLPGAVIGAGIGGPMGLLGSVGGPLATAGLLGYGAYKGIKGTGLLGKGDERDISGELEDRNRVVPFLNNKFLGGAGGALLGNLVASEAGLQGPMSWLAPVIGGIAGYNYLPQMMNKWKDPVGVGANSISPWAARTNRMVIGQ
jgi:hypothetical protein